MTPYRIELPYACFGVVVDKGKIVEAAPIARWTIGKDAKAVFEYFKKTKGKVERL